MHSCFHVPISWRLLGELLSATSEKAEEWGFNRYLADLREVEKQTDVLDDYYIAHRKAKEYGFRPGSRHALIVRHEDLDEFRFIETVFQNAGYNLKIFTEEAEALDWIRK